MRPPPAATPTGFTADLIVLVRIQRRQQPAGDDQVPPSRQAQRRADCRRQPVPRARARALLDSVDRRERTSTARRSPTTGSRCTPAATSRSCSACCWRWSIAAASTRPSSSARTTGFEQACAQGGRGRLGPHRATTAACRASASSTFADLLVTRPNAVFVWSMGLTQHAHGVDTVKALVNVGLARGLLGRPALRPGADSRPLGRAGRRRSRLRATPRSTRRAGVWNAPGAFRCRRRTGGRRAR